MLVTLPSLSSSSYLLPSCCGKSTIKVEDLINELSWLQQRWRHAAGSCMQHCSTSHLETLTLLLDQRSRNHWVRESHSTLENLIILSTVRRLPPNTHLEKSVLTAGGSGPFILSNWPLSLCGCVSVSLVPRTPSQHPRVLQSSAANNTDTTALQSNTLWQQPQQPTARHWNDIKNHIISVNQIR